VHFWEGEFPRNDVGALSLAYARVRHFSFVYPLAPERAGGRANAFKRLNSKGKMLILGDARRWAVLGGPRSSNSLSLSLSFPSSDGGNFSCWLGRFKIKTPWAPLLMAGAVF
jgi:hypothetical protein